MNETLKVIIITVIVVIVFAFALDYFAWNYPASPANGPITEPRNPDVASKQDIADSIEATKNINCILIAVSGVSPHNNQVYPDLGNCQLNWLVANRNWTKYEGA